MVWKTYKIFLWCEWINNVSPKSERERERFKRGKSLCTAYRQKNRRWNFSRTDSWLKCVELKETYPSPMRVVFNIIINLPVLYFTYHFPLILFCCFSMLLLLLLLSVCISHNREKSILLYVYQVFALSSMYRLEQIWFCASNVQI